MYEDLALHGMLRIVIIIVSVVIVIVFVSLLLAFFFFFSLGYGILSNTTKRPEKSLKHH